MSLAWAEFLAYWGNWTLVGALVIGVVSTYAVIVSGNVKEAALKLNLANAAEVAATANEYAAKLAVELEQARNNAKQLDANLLHEQRLTSNERWRLRRLERAVLPRSNFVDWDQLIADLKAGHFAPINLAVLGAPAEARSFGFDLLHAFQEAGLLKGFFELAPSNGRVDEIAAVDVFGIPEWNQI